jgi:hypothetical protein
MAWVLPPKGYGSGMTAFRDLSARRAHLAGRRNAPNIGAAAMVAAEVRSEERIGLYFSPSRNARRLRICTMIERSIKTRRMRLATAGGEYFPCQERLLVPRAEAPWFGQSFGEIALLRLTPHAAAASRTMNAPRARFPGPRSTTCHAPRSPPTSVADPGRQALSRAARAPRLDAVAAAG